ncbi:MAG: lipopolysaccharide kinase InaA family protein [Desulfobacterales bacterium]|jgi:tRNA A-37 threonylcarbamoyl transferase component Bud32
MTPKLNLPPESGSFVWPFKINADNIIKAEANCLIFTEQLEDGTSAVIKMYYRRGLANVTREYVLNFRVQREFRILRHLVNCGIPCTRPLFWTYGYCKAYGFYEVLCTRHIPNAISLRTFLSSASITDQNIDLGPLMALVYNMHRCGVYHGALSTKNILIDSTDSDQAKYFHIDLARGWLFPDSILDTRIAWFDLLKLVKKVESRLGIGYCRPYLSHYCLGGEAINKFYRDAGHYQSTSRKHKRLKNIMKVKVFFSAILTHLNQRVL